MSKIFSTLAVVLLITATVRASGVDAPDARICQKATGLLSAVRQAEAERLVFVGVSNADMQDGRVCRKAIELLSAGRQADAERLVFQRLKKSASVRVAFFAAVLIRSRFEIDMADQLFDRIASQVPTTLEGRTAKLVTAIDRGDAAEANFKDLDALSATHPDDPLVLWMVAVECRQLRKPAIGIQRYTKLLKTFDPGPALVHQTLGNLLRDDHQYQAALAQYEIAIQMEPAAWDYNCKGLALMDMNRYPEAAEAYKKATELDPDYELAWSNWAILCDLQGDKSGAAEKRAKLAAIRAKQR